MDDTNETNRGGNFPHGDNWRGWISQRFQMFCNSCGFTISGGRFYSIGRDMNIYNVNPGDLQRLWGISCEILRLMGHLLRDLPPSMRHTNANALIITDALGERLTLPWSIIRSYEALHNILVAHFEDKIGEKRVLRRDYCIAQERGGTLVDAEKWNELMYTREELTMIMLIDRIWREGASELCPKCGKTSIGTYENQGWRI